MQFYTKIFHYPMFPGHTELRFFFGTERVSRRIYFTQKQAKLEILIKNRTKFIDKVSDLPTVSYEEEPTTHPQIPILIPIKVLSLNFFQNSDQLCFYLPARQRVKEKINGIRNR